MGLACTSAPGLPFAVLAKLLESRPRQALSCNIEPAGRDVTLLLPPALKPQTALVVKPAVAERDKYHLIFSGSGGSLSSHLALQMQWCSD